MMMMMITIIILVTIVTVFASLGHPLSVGRLVRGARANISSNIINDENRNKVPDGSAQWVTG